MKGALLALALVLPASPVLGESFGGNVISRLMSIFPRTSGGTNLIQGQTLDHEPCRITVRSLSAADSDHIMGMVDITLTAQTKSVNFRSTDGQLRERGVVANGVDVSTTHQDGMFSNQLVTQYLKVAVSARSGNPIRGTVFISDGSRGTLSCTNEPFLPRVELPGI